MSGERHCDVYVPEGTAVLHDLPEGVVVYERKGVAFIRVVTPNPVPEVGGVYRNTMGWQLEAALGVSGPFDWKAGTILPRGG